MRSLVGPGPAPGKPVWRSVWEVRVTAGSYSRLRAQVWAGGRKRFIRAARGWTVSVHVHVHALAGQPLQPGSELTPAL